MNNSNFTYKFIKFGLILIWIQICFDTTLYALSENIEDENYKDILGMSLKEMLDVQVVSASMITRSLSDAPAVITVISSQQINERGYQDIAEALKSVTGIDILYDYYQYNLGIRGVNGGMRAGSRVVKVMIDGQPVSFRPGSQNFLGKELIPISAIKQIEIIRGPVSALYGANAFLGVINIITKKYQDLKNPVAEIRFGACNEKKIYGVEASGGTHFGDFEFVASASFNRCDRSGLSPVNVPGSNKYDENDVSENDISIPFSIFSKLDFSNEDIGDFSIDFNYQYLDSYGEFQDWGLLTHNNRLSIHNYFLRGRYLKSLSSVCTSKISMALSGGGPNKNEQLDIDKEKHMWLTRDFGYKGFDLSGELTFDIDSHFNISCGLDFTNDNQNLLTYYLHKDNLRPIPAKGKVFGDTSFTNIGVFAESMIYPFAYFGAGILPSFGITAGLRYDKHNIYEDVFNYRLAFSQNLISDIYAKLLIGTSFKAPSSTQLYSNYIVTQGVVGNPDLKPERARNIELALLSKFFNRLVINASVFHNEIDDIVELTLPMGDISNVRPYNIANVISNGFELEVYYSYSNLGAYANYSYQSTLVKKDNPFWGALELDAELYPTNLIKSGVNYKIPELFLNLNIEGRFIDGRIASQPNNYEYDPVNYYTNRYALDEYFVLDILISTYKLKLIEDNETILKIKINNILDEKYAWPGFDDYDIPGLGRYMVFTLAQRF